MVLCDLNYFEGTRYVLLVCCPGPLSDNVFGSCSMKIELLLIEE
jgi:hypothetical protein